MLEKYFQIQTNMTSIQCVSDITSFINDAGKLLEPCSQNNHFEDNFLGKNITFLMLSLDSDYVLILQIVFCNTYGSIIVILSVASKPIWK